LISDLLRDIERKMESIKTKKKFSFLGATWYLRHKHNLISKQQAVEMI
jgi:hypothetical protein